MIEQPIPTDTTLAELPDVEAEESRPRGGRAHEVIAVLQEEIESGQLPPGSPLDERALAARFNVSRTPVREALQQLAARQLVRIAPRQGVMVARLSVSQVRAITESIAELESTCARLAARRINDGLRQQLEAVLQLCQDAAIEGDGVQYAAANAQFHEVIYAAGRNPYLADLIRTARRQIRRYTVSNFATKAQINQSLQDHRRIARAIEAGDEISAAQQMMLHVPTGSTGFSEFLARIPMHLFEAEPDA